MLLFGFRGRFDLAKAAAENRCSFVSSACDPGVITLFRSSANWAQVSERRNHDLSYCAPEPAHRAGRRRGRGGHSCGAVSGPRPGAAKFCPRRAIRGRGHELGHGLDAGGRHRATPTCRLRPASSSSASSTSTAPPANERAPDEPRRHGTMGDHARARAAGLRPEGGPIGYAEPTLSNVRAKENE